jgi:hypothetical protein
VNGRQEIPSFEYVISSGVARTESVDLMSWTGTAAMVVFVSVVLAVDMRLIIENEVPWNPPGNQERFAEIGLVEEEERYSGERLAPRTAA